MLKPDDRQTLIDALRPPPGYGLGCAVGTTFSLQLDTALTAPAAFALYNVLEQDRRAELEPLELLESIRRHADRFSIFFQAGQAAVPVQRRLFAYLERAVIPVTAPRGGVFHPKVWALRFEAPDAPPVYRALCSSRNLTYDRSWDTLLRLDSCDEETASGRHFDGKDLARFVAALPDLAVLPIAEERRSAIWVLAEQLASVRWALPEGVSSGRFHALGLGEDRGPPFPAHADRIAVVSPFLSAGLLRRLPKAAGRRVLVSQPREIAACGRAVRDGFEEAYVLDPDARPARQDASVEDVSATPADPAAACEGLHAKLYVFDQARTATVFTGSANATHAAFSANVEMLAELSGPIGTLGVEALLAAPHGDVQTLLSFLRRFDLNDSEAMDQSEPEEDMLDHLRREIASRPIEARAVPAAEDDRFTLAFRMCAAAPDLPEGLEWRAWPVTLPQQSARPVDPAADFAPEYQVSFEGITAFLANELSLGGHSTRFVLAADLVEAPENRAARLLGLLIGDSARFLRFLLMLLADDALDRYGFSGLLDDIEEPGGTRWRSNADSLPLLEALLRTLASEPGRLEHVKRLIDELQREPEGHRLLPPDLDAIWSPIWAAAQERLGGR